MWYKLGSKMSRPYNSIISWQIIFAWHSQMVEISAFLHLSTNLRQLIYIYTELICFHICQFQWQWLVKRVRHV